MWDVEKDEQGNWWTTVNDERYDNYGPDGQGAAEDRVEYEELQLQVDAQDYDPATGFYAY